jgi:predicted Zn finger-like uncharacterized protein
MAGRMSAPSWEKSGNVTWVACRSCRAWFPVAAELVEQDAVELVCPRCGDRFRSSASADIRKP